MAPYLGSPDEAVDGEKLKLRQIECSGTPYEVGPPRKTCRNSTDDEQIGLQHGREAKSQVASTIDFYTQMFRESSKMDWPRVREVAMDFEPVLRQKWPQYVEEMQGKPKISLSITCPSPA